MISKIDYLRNFALYRNFQWGTLSPFSKCNLIYGWNYSGKTTLSRLFQLLEAPSLLARWPNISFRLELADGSEVTHNNLPQQPFSTVRVFNRDFIQQNFASEYTAPAIFILGAENIALRKRLEVFNARRDQVQQIFSQFTTQAEQIKNEINRVGTDNARNVGSLLGDRNFRRPNIERRVEEVRDNLTDALLSDEEVTAKLAIVRTTDEWRRLEPLSMSLPDWNAHFQSISELLSQTASSRAIDRLNADRILEKWVREGLLLHQDRPKCEFCGSTIPDERLEQLRGHFSQEYEALVQALSAKIQECQNLQLDVSLPDERDFSPDLKTEISSLREQFKNWIDWAQKVRADLIKILNHKTTKIESELSCEVDSSRITEGESLLNQINVLIQRHNQAASQLDKTKTEAKTALERHFAAEFFRDNDLVGKETLRDKTTQRVTDAQDVLRCISSQIAAIEQQVRQQSIAAAKLNGVLHFLLTGNNIKVTSVGDGLFEFHRDGVAAENLSDGEKTAIAFSYFLIKLEANGAVLTDTIVFIDDPISSLDSNHIYAVYALIIKRLADYSQIFISTHNSEFFNLMKDAWFKARNHYANNANACSYYVNRTIDGNAQWLSVLNDLPELLRKYKSEYHFVFAQLHAFANAPSPSLHEAYTAPNLVRKFLEAYLGFRKPCISKWSDKLDLLGFSTQEEQCEIQKFADDASHLQGISRALQQPNFITTAQSNVSKVISGLKAEDFEHYSSLCTVIGVTP